ncbi:MAG: hypothetical protein ACM3S4_05955 [Burkholderiales bacterium]
MTDTSYLYEYFANKSPDDKTKKHKKEKKGDAAQDKRETKCAEGSKHA